MKRENELDFNSYRVVALVSGKEIIIKDFYSADIVTNASSLTCSGIFTSNNFGNSWVPMIINGANILYTRDLFEGEKRIVKQVERNNQ